MTNESYAQATSELQSLEKMLSESKQVRERLQREIVTLKMSPVEMADKDQQYDDSDDHGDRACCQSETQLATEIAIKLQELLSKSPESREQLSIITKLKDLIKEKDKGIESLKDHHNQQEEYLC